MIAMIAAIAMAIAIPVAIVVAVRVVAGIFSAGTGSAPPNHALESRMRRMEEAIDAMAVQIERLRRRDEERYVPGERAEPRQLPPPDEPPTFR